MGTKHGRRWEDGGKKIRNIVHHLQEASSSVYPVEKWSRENNGSRLHSY
jgi:hypothetical protein